MTGHDTAVTTTSARRWWHSTIGDRLRAAVGGAARLRVIMLLAGVLGLSAADAATVGAVAAELERSLHVGNTEIGLLVTCSIGVGALATSPVGALVDRVQRTRLLSTNVLLRSAAMIVSGAATSYPMLLITRLALGAVVATACQVGHAGGTDFLSFICRVRPCSCPVPLVLAAVLVVVTGARVGAVAPSHRDAVGALMTRPAPRRGY